ncbi:MAG: hypothetical protein Q9197_006570 [Variospora fuerteventurae]
MANNPAAFAGKTPNYYNNPPSSAWTVSVTDSVGLALVTLVVFARCYTKFAITKAPGWEDYICLAAYAIYVIFVSIHYVHLYDYGGGRHSYDMPPEFLYGFFWTKVVANHLYIVGCTLAKFSLLAFLYRIFNVNLGFRIASWTLAAVLGIWTSVTLLLCLFACKPIGASWDINLYFEPGTRCNIRVPNVTTIHGFCNVITDFALLLLPVPMVWNLHVGAKKKFGLAAVFATGVFICAVSIVRQYILYNTDKYGDGYYTTRVMVWMDIEFSFSIIVATLPVLTPLFKKLSILSTWLPTLRSKITRSSNHKRSADTSSRGGGGGGNIRHSKGKGQDYDVERNALRGDDKLGEWKECGGKESWDGYDGGRGEGVGTAARSESDITLRDLEAVVGPGAGAEKTRG